jgi:hypothetical protein
MLTATRRLHSAAETVVLIRTMRALLCVAALALASCELAGTATTHKTYVVFVSDCASNQLNANCQVRPLEQLDITVSPSAQRVAWKKTGLDGVTTDYVIGTRCAVLGSEDFHCDELSQDGDKVSPNQALDHWPELFFRSVLIDDHLYSWCLWYVSSGNSPASATKGQFDLLSNTIASVIGVIVLVIGSLYVWFWLQVRWAAAFQRSRDEDAHRKKLGY